MVLTPSGEVLTNNHVVDGATVISVTDIGNGRTYPATVVGYDRSRDVAVLQLTGASGLTTVPIGNSSTVTVGAKVTALGNAGGTGGTPSRATGRIIALHRSITAGDAGGGNYRASDRTHRDERRHPARRLRRSAGERLRQGDRHGRRRLDGLATHVDRYRGVRHPHQAGGLDQSPDRSGYRLLDGAHRADRVPRRGDRFSPEAVGGTAANGSEFSGALLSGILPDSPAQGAGLAAGDVITSLGGQAVSSGSALADLLVPYRPGDSVSLQWVDGSGQIHSATVTLASGPSA